MIYNYTACPILNDSSEYLRNEIRYEFRSCGNLFGFEEDNILLKRIFCRWRREFLKITIIFLNGTIIFQTHTIVACKMMSLTTCDKKSIKIIQSKYKII